MEHEKAKEIMVTAITEFLHKASSVTQPDQQRSFVADIHNERSRSIFYESKADSDFVSTSHSTVDDSDESEVVLQTLSHQLRPRPVPLSHSTNTNSSTLEQSIIESSPLSITESSIVPDCCWRHQSDAIPRVALETTKTQDVRALERKASIAICTAQLSLVFGLILHHPKPRTDRRQDERIEEGDVVLKIWEANNRSATHPTCAPGGSSADRNICLRSDLVGANLCLQLHVSVALY